MCITCKKNPAVSICTNCWYDIYAFFCEDCSEKHPESCEDFEDYAEMPVVNSPRMSACAYTGGLIDLERDGPYNK